MNTLLIVLTLMAGAPAADLVKVTEHTAKLADGSPPAPATVEEMAWLTFDRSEPRALTIYLALRQKDGELREEKFRMTRAK